MLLNLDPNIDFFISLHQHLGSILIVNGTANENYISDIQHVRRRETVAMTPANALIALNALVEQSIIENKTIDVSKQKQCLKRH